MRWLGLSASNFTTGGALGFNAITGFPGGTRRTRSVYLETGVPITNAKMDLPGLRSLDLTLGYRAEFLSPGDNTAKTPKVGILWKPFDDQLVIRGTWKKGFHRAFRPRFVWASRRQCPDRERSAECHGGHRPWRRGYSRHVCLRPVPADDIIGHRFFLELKKEF